MWSELSSLKQHAESSQNRNLPVTWLVQYNVLDDEDVIDLLRSYEGDELGIFLEVSEDLATDASVSYTLGSGDWARADKVFFSGYEIAARKRMVDKVFENFRDVFGFYPTSVGAWYIDPVTLEYVVEKYGVTVALTVTDQYATDGYQIWGSPWGTPYYPSRWNSITPAQSTKTKLPVVVLQWALRDPERAYGTGVSDSTYSLQPNDYVGHHDLTITYFRSILDAYLDTQNDFSQATIGLEVGTESKFLEELDRQIAEAKDRQNRGAQIVTMSAFADWYKKEYPDISPGHIISSDKAFWYSSPFYRVGLVLSDGVLQVRDLRFYDDTYIEIDAVAADKRTRLYRSIFAPIDDLLYHNGNVIGENITDITVERNTDDSITLLWNDNQKLHLDTKKAVLNNKTIIDAHEKTDIGVYRSFWKRFSQFWAKYARISLPEYHPIPLRYTTIGEKRIFGLQTKKDRIFAISFPPLRIGFSYFPYQSLSWFKSWPSINIPKLFFSSSSALFTHWVEEENSDGNLKILPRHEILPDVVLNLEGQGWVRILENSAASVWQKINQ